MTDAELRTELEAVYGGLPNEIGALDDISMCEAQLLYLEDVLSRWAMERELGEEQPLDVVLGLVDHEYEVSCAPREQILELTDFSAQVSYEDPDEDEQEHGGELLRELTGWLEKLIEALRAE